MKKDIVTIDDLTDEEIETIFSLADYYLKEMGDPAQPYRIQGRRTDASQFILATLFYEPSTRTRFSFESAMTRLGGGVLSSADPLTTSAAKGESIADTIRVVSNYADLIVLRHPYEGAARVAADFASVPVINAGDGGHEHPTQTLCDLYTLRREKGSLQKLKNMTVLLCGDLKNGRTIHSLVYALARFGARIMPYAAEGLELPDHVTQRLQEDYNCQRTHFSAAEGLPVDVVYVTPDKPHQRSLFEDYEVTVDVKHGPIDVCYVTRLQKERLSDEARGKAYPVVDTAFLKGRMYRHSHVLHPLPRVAELGYDMDDDPRGVYFKQASYGVCVRMGLIAWLLGLRRDVSAASQDQPASEAVSEAAAHQHDVYEREDGIVCGNPKCVSTQDTELRYLKPRFLIINKPPVRLRCVYCEQEINDLFVANKRNKKYAAAREIDKEIRAEDAVFFATKDEAEAAGFVARKESRLQVSSEPH